MEQKQQEYYSLRKTYLFGWFLIGLMIIAALCVFWNLFWMENESRKGIFGKFIFGLIPVSFIIRCIDNSLKDKLRLKGMYEELIVFKSK